MKQYKITFYISRNRSLVVHSVCYREFQSNAELKEWVDDFANCNQSINNWLIEPITVETYLENI